MPRFTALNIEDPELLLILTPPVKATWAYQDIVVFPQYDESVLYKLIQRRQEIACFTRREMNIANEHSEIRAVSNP